MSLTVCLSALYAGRMQMSMAERQFQVLVFLIPAFSKMNKNDARKLLTITDAADKINQKILRHKDECSFDKDKEATDMLPQQSLRAGFSLFTGNARRRRI